MHASNAGNLRRVMHAALLAALLGTSGHVVAQDPDEEPDEQQQADDTAADDTTDAADAPEEVAVDTGDDPADETDDADNTDDPTAEMVAAGQDADGGDAADLASKAMVPLQERN